MKSLQCQQLELECITSLGDEILATSHPDSVITVKSWVTVAKSRFQEVSRAPFCPPLPPAPTPGTSAAPHSPTTRACAGPAQRRVLGSRGCSSLSPPGAGGLGLASERAAVARLLPAPLWSHRGGGDTLHAHEVGDAVQPEQGGSPGSGVLGIPTPEPAPAAARGSLASCAPAPGAP